MATEAPTHKHKFRYLLPPGNNFAFVAKFRIWIIISCLLMAASVASLFVNNATRGSYMNWTIDFRGGTEINFTFLDATTQQHITVEPGKIREALDKAGEEGVDVSEIEVQGQAGMIVRSPRFSALRPETEQAGKTAFEKAFADRGVLKMTWSGDDLYVRVLGCPKLPCKKADKKPVQWAEAAPVFKAAGLEVWPWSPEDQSQYTHADEGTGEYNEMFAMRGVDKQYEDIIEKALGGKVTAQVIKSYGVGAKAGSQLRDDAAKSIVYAIFLIMLYLAFRFDIRYAPGAAFATIHDAVMVIGVFSVTWTEVSLTSVAGLLTVMGYSVNDTVIVFDRIRENQAKLKDKKVERIIDISINEMLVRTILTSSTVFATTLIMNIFGTGLVKNFAFAMNIGVIVGTYSSIFLAAPIFMYISRRWYSGPAPAKRRMAAVTPQTEDSEED
jgi:preprotein translocase subunit SecF